VSAYAESRTLRIFGLIDESAPIIEVLNDTRIEYELGLAERLDFNIHDDTPREFWVLLDFTEIQEVRIRLERASPQSHPIL